MSLHFSAAMSLRPLRLCGSNLRCVYVPLWWTLSSWKTLRNVLVDEREEPSRELFGVSFQGCTHLAVDEDRTPRRLAGSRQTDPDVGGLGLARTVDDAAHDGHLESLDSVVLFAPLWHPLFQVNPDPLGELSEVGAGGSTAARTRGDGGGKRPDAKRLKQFVCCDHLVSSVTSGRGGQGESDGVADAFGEQGPHCGRRPHEASGAHSRLGEAEMQGLPSFVGQTSVDVNQIRW